MAPPDTDSEGFKAVVKPRSTKKAKTTPTGEPRVKPAIETELRAIFQLPKHPRSEFKPAQQMKKLVSELLKHDATIAFHPVENAEDILYPQDDSFPTKEKEFTQYFQVHPIPKRSIYKHSVTIGCRLLSTKTIKEMKTSSHEDITLLNWLKDNKIFLEADTLGRKTVRTMGYLFFIHPQITHHVSLKGILQEAITDVKLTKAEVEAIDPQALNYYPYSDGDDEHTTMTERDDIFGEDDDSKFVPIPFELFKTDVGYGTGTNRVATKAIGIKSNVEFGNLLNELLLRMKVGTHIFPKMQYIPVGLAANIGVAPYTQLICDNNEYLTTLTSIPVIGISDSTLNYTIPVKTDQGTDEPRTIREIIMATEWCLQIEPTQTKGRFLMITTKGNLDAGREWLDDNLPPIFTKYLPKNPKYTPDEENPVPHRTDQKQPNTTLDNYADQIRKKITVQPRKDNQPPTYARPPLQRTGPQATISYSEAAKKNLNPQQTNNTNPPKKKKARNSDAISTTTEHSTETTNTSMTMTTAANLKQDILSALRIEITQIIQQDIQPLKQDLQSLQHTVQNTTEQHTNDMKLFQANLATSHEQFKQQMNHISDQFQAQLKAQQQQFDTQFRALFAHFSSHFPTPQPPSSTNEGGMH